MPTSITWQGALLALQIFGAGLLVSYAVRWLARRLLLWRGRGPSSAAVFAQVTQWVVVFAFLSAAMTVVFPSVRPVDILGGVTIVSVAAGIAFQTVLGNMFAGLVILARDRFRVDDQISMDSLSGTVVAIGLTSTVVRTFDGRLVVVPNTVLHDNIVTVQTGYEQVRSTVTFNLDPGADFEHARTVALKALYDIRGVLNDPEPKALLTEVDEAAVTLELRFWTGSLQLETLEARNLVVSRVLQAFAAQGVATQSATVMIEPGPVLRSLLNGSLRPPTSSPAAD
ncbi:mechanosensitive ion channel family protein [Propioniciclava soli]|uniref:mechanosensitive ion channel family protein n=1 Tax=Propioniciclava soli TaxID=2775081 RepID=UPI001E4D34C6|nr:mechanosensitive ion channel domain-containing protein [Propioniciclava soli]